MPLSQPSHKSEPSGSTHAVASSSHIQVVPNGESGSIIQGRSLRSHCLQISCWVGQACGGVELAEDVDGVDDGVDDAGDAEDDEGGGGGEIGDAEEEEGGVPATQLQPSAPREQVKPLAHAGEQSLAVHW